MEPFISFADQIGISKIIGFVGTLAMTAIVWITHSLPWWGSILVGLGVGALLMLGLKWASQAHLNYKLANSIKVDREALAERLSNLSSEIGLLYGAAKGPADAEWRQSARSIPGPHELWGRQGLAESSAVSEYYRRFNTPAWQAINEAKLCVKISINDTWTVSHGVRDLSDILKMVDFLLKLSVVIRYNSELITIDGTVQAPISIPAVSPSSQ